MKILDSVLCGLLEFFCSKEHKKTNDEISNDHLTKDVYEPNKYNSFLGKVKANYDLTGKTVVDVGCGTGDLVLSLAQSGCKKVVGVDIDADRIASAKRKAKAENLDGVTEFLCVDFINEYNPDYKFDLAVNTASFEHIPDPDACLKKISDCLNEDGILCTIFGPLWLSPYGAHMYEYCKVPWVHLLFPEHVVLKVRKKIYRPDENPASYEEIRGHLNRITVRKFLAGVKNAGLKTDKLRMNPGADTRSSIILKLFNALINHVYGFKELGSFQLFAVLSKIHNR